MLTTTDFYMLMIRAQILMLVQQTTHQAPSLTLNLSYCASLLCIHFVLTE